MQDFTAYVLWQYCLLVVVHIVFPHHYPSPSNPLNLKAAQDVFLYQLLPTYRSPEVPSISSLNVLATIENSQPPSHQTSSRQQSLNLKHFTYLIDLMSLSSTKRLSILVNWMMPGVSNFFRIQSHFCRSLMNMYSTPMLLQ